MSPMGKTLSTKGSPFLLPTPPADTTWFGTGKCTKDQLGSGVLPGELVLSCPAGQVAEGAGLRGATVVPARMEGIGRLG